MKEGSVEQQKVTVLLLQRQQLHFGLLDEAVRRQHLGLDHYAQEDWEQKG